MEIMDEMAFRGLLIKLDTLPSAHVVLLKQISLTEDQMTRIDDKFIVITALENNNDLLFIAIANIADQTLAEQYLEGVIIEAGGINIQNHGQAH